jgi:hypothetical protein
VAFWGSSLASIHLSASGEMTSESPSKCSKQKGGTLSEWLIDRPVFVEMIGQLGFFHGGLLNSISFEDHSKVS